MSFFLCVCVCVLYCVCVCVWRFIRCYKNESQPRQPWFFQKVWRLCKLNFFHFSFIFVEKSRTIASILLLSLIFIHVPSDVLTFFFFSFFFSRFLQSFVLSILYSSTRHSTFHRNGNVSLLRPLFFKLPWIRMYIHTTTCLKEKIKK